MARNGAKGGGRRGAIRGRTQFKLPNGHYAKRDRQTGEILAIKADLKPWKGVVIEKAPPITLPRRSARTGRPAHLGLPAHPGRVIRRREGTITARRRINPAIVRSVALPA